MNPISAFFVRHIIIVFFLYGLAFFVMGLALALASRRTSEFRFVQAIRPLAAFGILHGLHEWIEMFQKVAALSGGYVPTPGQEAGRLVVLVASLVMLLLFGIILLTPPQQGKQAVYLPLIGMLAIWLIGLLIVTVAYQPDIEQILVLADTMARYSLAIPGALLGTWALMRQQRTFRQHHMPQFGRDLVWCATALFLYGVIGQLFVRQTLLFPSTAINSTAFLQWFGIPVQLFRGVLAAVLAFYMMRALNAFELENQRRLREANEARLQAQAKAIATERRISREMEQLNNELRLVARELALLLDLSNLLSAALSLSERLHQALEKIIHSLNFSDAGMILLTDRSETAASVAAATSFQPEAGFQALAGSYEAAKQLGLESISHRMARCQHQDGKILEFFPQQDLANQACRQHNSPLIMLAFPLAIGERIIGSLVLVAAAQPARLTFEEARLMAGIAQQMGLSIETARLQQEAHRREKLLADLLHQVVGAQEAERKRIARELHDATGQSLTAVALGLRGIEGLLGDAPLLVREQLGELKNFSTSALGELRRLIADLRPPQLDDLGLVAALQWYIQTFQKRFPINVKLEVAGKTVRLPSEYETVLFRITQEALTNVAKHADASQVTVAIDSRPDQISLMVKDDGRGFELDKLQEHETDQSGWGLLGIQERALLLGGHYEIDSAPGRGVCIRVTVPLLTETDHVEDQAITG